MRRRANILNVDKQTGKNQDKNRCHNQIKCIFHLFNPEIVWMKETEAHDDFIISPLMSLFPLFSVCLKKFVSDFGAFVALRITL
jgi:hypothetical protein